MKVTIETMEFLLVLSAGLLLLSTVKSCADYLNKSLGQFDQTQFCSSISSFANCLATNHALMGSPFGINMAHTIDQSVINSVEQLCAVKCPLSVVYKSIKPTSRNLLKVGNELKICVFDAIIASGGKKKKLCSGLREMVKCMLEASTKGNYLMTEQHIQTGTYIAVEILKNSFNVKCGKSVIRDIEDRLFQKCRGRYAI